MLQEDGMNQSTSLQIVNYSDCKIYYTFYDSASDSHSKLVWPLILFSVLVKLAES